VTDWNRFPKLAAMRSGEVRGRVCGLLLVVTSWACSSPDGAAKAASTGGASGAGAEGKGGSGASAGSSGRDASDAGMSSDGGGRAGSSNAGAGGSLGNDWETTLVSLPIAARGELNVAQTTLDKLTFSVIFYAKFAMKRAQWDGCTKHQLGACWYYECPAGSSPVGTPDESIPINGDTVTLESSSSFIALSIDDDHYNGQRAEPFWPLTGDTVHFQAQGAQPAFRFGVKTPPTVWLKSVNGRAAPSSLVRSEGAKVDWETTGAGTVFFSIYRLDQPPVPAAICTFEAARGTGMLPATVLEHLEPGGDYRLLLRGDERILQDVDGYALDASLFAYGTNPLTLALE
jgi:hypothetical protein